MTVGRSEQTWIRLALASGAACGYGNVIGHLRTAWALELVRSGVYATPEEACTATNSAPYPAQMHLDIVEHGEWDETGARYMGDLATGTRPPSGATGRSGRPSSTIYGAGTGDLSDVQAGELHETSPQRCA